MQYPILHYPLHSLLLSIKTLLVSYKKRSKFRKFFQHPLWLFACLRLQLELNTKCIIKMPRLSSIRICLTTSSTNRQKPNTYSVNVKESTKASLYRAKTCFRTFSSCIFKTSLLGCTFFAASSKTQRTSVLE